MSTIKFFQIVDIKYLGENKYNTNFSVYNNNHFNKINQNRSWSNNTVGRRLPCKQLTRVSSMASQIVSRVCQDNDF